MVGIIFDMVDSVIARDEDLISRVQDPEILKGFGCQKNGRVDTVLVGN